MCNQEKKVLSEEWSDGLPMEVAIPEAHWKCSVEKN